MIRINITDNAEELGKKAAEAAASLIRDAIEEKSWCRMVLSTGTSQFEFFSALVKEDIDWSRVEIFHLDIHEHDRPRLVHLHGLPAARYG